MTTFNVKSRKTMPIEVTTVEAANRDQAIAKTIETAGEGESIEVMQVDVAEVEAAPTK